MDKLIKQRARCKATLTRIQTFSDQENVTFDSAEIAVRIESLKELWEKFDDIQGNIENLSDGTSEEILTSQAKEQEEFENKFFSTKAKLQGLLRSEYSSTSLIQPRNGDRGDQVRLPKLDLPTFSGSYTEWANFSDLFKTLVHDNSGLQDIQKIQYLKSCLKGDASKVIQALPSTSPNYKEAWQLVQERFDNPRLITAAHLKILLNLTALNSEEAPKLRKLLDTVLEQVRALEVLKANTWDHIIMHLVTEKLDPETRKHWELSQTSTVAVNFNSLKTFLQLRCQALEAIANTGQANKMRNEPKYKVNNISNRVMHTRIQNDTCGYCKLPHIIYRCDKFKGLTTQERLNAVKSMHLCYNCLSKDHGAKECMSSRCRQCDRKHHTLLHLSNFRNNSAPQNIQTATTSRQSNTVSTLNATAPAFNVLCNMTNVQSILPTALIYVSKDKRQWHPARAFLDGGSQTNIIKEQIARKLGLELNPDNQEITGLGSSSVGRANGFCTLYIKSRFNNYEKSINTYVMKEITGNLPTLPVDTSQIHHLQNIELADPSYFKPAGVDILLGTQVCAETTISLGSHSDLSPVAVNTKFGWIVAGDCPTKLNNHGNIQTYHCVTDLRNQLKTFWEIEEILPHPILTSEEQACEQHYLRTHQRDQTGRYIVSLPFKDGSCELGTSRTQAIQRFYQQERRLNQDPKLKKQYTEFIREYQELGHMKPADTQVSNDTIIPYYLPHHAVVKETSTTTKLRVVFDGSARSSTGVSLNNVLAIGPIIQQSIFQILLRFRTHKIPLIADVEKMYRQINMSETDQVYQRIVWREEPSHQLKDYQLTTVTYGMTSAPYHAIRCLKQLAEDEGKEHLEAAKVLKNDFYVDDCVSGGSTPQEVLTLQSELQVLLSKGGFTLRKWRSTIPLPSDSKELLNEEVSVLGILWKPESDKIVIVGKEGTNNMVTKRHILSSLAAIYDPLGLTAPVVLMAKLLVQRLWIDQSGWDDIISNELCDSWKDIKTSLSRLSDIPIPRHSGVINRDTEIHGFSDASEKAFGAAVYCRNLQEDGSYISHLICAKTRVAPIKQISLPRLELCGAILLVRLVQQVQDSLLLVDQRIYLWTDSTIVLAWINGTPQRWNTFVANRVSEIQSLRGNIRWNHIAGSDNPADWASRGTSANALLDCHIWWYGPAFLSKDFSSKTEEFTTIEEERKQVKVHTATSVITSEMWTRFSSLQKLLRVTAWMRRFAGKNRQQNRQGGMLLSASELREALHGLLRVAQQEHFQKEINLLQVMKHIPRQSKLNTLQPFIDPEGLLRVGGRIKHSTLPEEAKHPIICSGIHPLSKLIIRNAHEELLHAYPTLLLSHLQQNYWFLKGRDCVRKCVHDCITCLRARAKPCEQMMADLPACRVTPTFRAFLKCGIDYAGPIQLRLRPGRGRPTIIKGYIVLFICMVTKAVHLEAVSDMTTNAFIATLKRFIGRRGKPEVLYSDCGSNFLGAAPLIQQPNNEVNNFVIQQGINWKFNPPGSPHHGGLWEAAVKSTKRHLNRVLGRALPTFEQLSTILVQIEACLNSRPLCLNPTNPQDLNPLTPGHFLIGTSLLTIPEPDITDKPDHLLNYWDYIQARVQHFWNRWSKEYLVSLQQRSKWKTIQPDVSIGDLVILNDHRLPVASWPLARVTEIHPSNDGHVRTVTVKTATSTFKRSIRNLIRLPDMSPDSVVSK